MRYYFPSDLHRAVGMVETRVGAVTLGPRTIPSLYMENVPPLVITGEENPDLWGTTTIYRIYGTKLSGYAFSR